MSELGTSGELGEQQSRSGQAQEKLQQTAGQVKEKAQPALAQGRQKAEELRGQAGSRLREQVDTRSTQAGEQVRSLAGAVRTTGESLRSEGKERPAKVAEQAAEKAERLGGYLHESDADRILADVESFARRQPWLIAAAAGALGFLAARFLKTSSSGAETATDGRPQEMTSWTASVDVPAPPPAPTPLDAPVSDPLAPPPVDPRLRP